MKRRTPFFLLLALVAAVSCQQYSQFKAKMAEQWSKVKDGGSSGGWTHVDAADGGAVVDPLVGTCSIATHHDDYSAFTIGYPSGWLLDFSTDTILVVKDQTEMEGALVFPARLRRNDIPPERLAALFADGLGRSIARNGGTSKLVDKKTDGKIATATIQATVNGVELEGPLEVVERPGFVTLKLYWAPRDQFDGESSTLKQVLTCFQRQTLITSKKSATPPAGRVTKVGFAPAAAASASAAIEPLKPYRGRYMNASLPAGWVVRADTENGIDATSADSTEYVGLGWFEKPQRNQDPITLLRTSIARNHPGANVTRSGRVSSPDGWLVVEAEYEGGGGHGIERVAQGRGMSVTTEWWTTAAKWPTLHPTLEAMVGSIVITPGAVAKVNADIRAQLASYPHPTTSYASSSSASSSSGVVSGWQSPSGGQDKVNQEMDDYIRGQERVRNSAGEEIIAPTSAWNDSGPQGAGYYQATPGGGAELLTPE